MPPSRSREERVRTYRAPAAAIRGHLRRLATSAGASLSSRVANRYVSFYYFAGQCLVLLAGFISMPIMTRLLSKEEYGLLNLVFLTTTLLGTIAHLGFAPAIARFYAE